MLLDEFDYKTPLKSFRVLQPGRKIPKYIFPGKGLAGIARLFLIS
jgi:hypothetical protein